MTNHAITKVIKERLKTQVMASKWTSGQLIAAKITFWENIINTDIVNFEWREILIFLFLSFCSDHRFII